MLANILFRSLKQLRHLRLRQPHSLILQPCLDPRPAVVALINDEFAFVHTLYENLPFLDRAVAGLPQHWHVLCARTDHTSELRLRSFPRQRHLATSVYGVVKAANCSASLF